jgi:DNA-binding IclR family transcriptional regulator
VLPAQPNQSLIDGLAVLQAVAGRETAAGGRELGRELGLEATRVNRLLKTLAALGLARQDAQRKYRPGPGIHVLAAQALFGSGLLRRASPHLEALHRHGLVVAMGVLWRDRVSYLYHASPGMSAGEALGRAGLFPAARSGIGVALLARGGVAADDTGSTRELRGMVREARLRGYALVPTNADGRTYSLGVALADDSGAAIALSGRIDRRRLKGLVVSLQQAADRIAATPPLHEDVSS